VEKEKAEKRKADEKGKTNVAAEVTRLNLLEIRRS
jgi:hypothetical protein